MNTSTANRRTINWPRTQLAALAAIAALFISACGTSSGEAVESAAGVAAGSASSVSEPAAPDPTPVPPTPTETAVAEPDPAPTNTPATVEADEPEPAPTVDPEVAEAERQRCATNPTGVIESIIDAGGYEHPFRLFVPSSYDGSPMPLVMNWHGFSANGAQQAEFTSYEELAEAEGFLVAHPTGASTPFEFQTHWELAQFADFDDPDVDAIVMAETMIDHVIDDYCADPARVYSTGFSNGGWFTSSLLCELADRIAAGVAVAGVTHTGDCDPERAVPFMAMHGTDDKVVRFNGVNSNQEIFTQSMPGEFAEFAATNGCDPEPTVESVSDEVIRYDYVNCTDDVGQVFFEIVDGGHTWPGAANSSPLLGHSTTDISATADGWAFMSQYSLP